MPRHTKEVCSRQLFRYSSALATHRERRSRTLGKISDLVVLRIINETAVVVITSGMEDKDTGNSGDLSTSSSRRTVHAGGNTRVV